MKRNRTINVIRVVGVRKERVLRFSSASALKARRAWYLRLSVLIYLSSAWLIIWDRPFSWRFRSTTGGANSHPVFIIVVMHIQNPNNGRSLTPVHIVYSVLEITFNVLVIKQVLRSFQCKEIRDVSSMLICISLCESFNIRALLYSYRSSFSVRKILYLPLNIEIPRCTGAHADVNNILAIQNVPKCYSGCRLLVTNFRSWPKLGPQGAWGGSSRELWGRIPRGSR